MLVTTQALSVQLSGLVTDNQAKLHPALEALDQVTNVLEQNQANLAQAVALAGPYYRLLGNASRQRPLVRRVPVRPHPELVPAARRPPGQRLLAARKPEVSHDEHQEGRRRAGHPGQPAESRPRTGLPGQAACSRRSATRCLAPGAGGYWPGSARWSWRSGLIVGGVLLYQADPSGHRSHRLLQRVHRRLPRLGRADTRGAGRHRRHGAAGRAGGEGHPDGRQRHPCPRRRTGRPWWRRAWSPTVTSSSPPPTPAARGSPAAPSSRSPAPPFRSRSTRSTRP